MRARDETQAAVHAAESHRGTSVLVGLHTCGDLAPTMIRVFLHAGRAVSGLVSVGCCYTKLSEPALDMSDGARAHVLCVRAEARWR